MQTIVAQGATTVRAGPHETSVPMLFREGAEDHLSFRSGSAPGAGQVAVPYGMAVTEHLRAGDPLTVVGPTNERTTLEISGVFDPPVHEDDFWYGDQSPFPLGDTEAPVPLVVSEKTGLNLAPRLNLGSHFYWDVYLAFTGTSYAEANALPGVYETFKQEIYHDLNNLTPHVDSGISTIVAQIDRSVTNLRVPILLVLFRILVVTYFVLAGVGVLIVSRQSFEIAVLRSRGFSRGSLVCSAKPCRRCSRRWSRFPSASPSASRWRASPVRRTVRAHPAFRSPCTHRAHRSSSAPRPHWSARSC